MDKAPIVRIDNIVVQEMDKEILIYDLQKSKAFCLNETSALIYQLCDGKNSISDISSAISKKLNQPITDELIWLALDNFRKDDLLEKSGQFEIDFKGLNRRQVIKKVGLATMIALPIVSSVIAPTSAMAQSGLLALNAACTTSPQCASGQCNSSGPSAGKCCVPGIQANQQVPGTRQGSPFSVDSATCTTLTLANCCSGNRVWFVTSNCFCG
jgi:Coenzyme PQQ synthesis protein D (PqqD)